jgi:hypothetical protein
MNTVEDQVTEVLIGQLRELFPDRERRTLRLALTRNSFDVAAASEMLLANPNWEAPHGITSSTLASQKSQLPLHSPVSLRVLNQEASASANGEDKSTPDYHRKSTKKHMMSFLEIVCCNF